MNLGTYIRALLDFKERVVLAGFGTLEIRSPDRAEPPSGKRIDPPGKSVRFDSSYSKDDGLLASSVAEGEGIDRDEAQQRVLELIDAIKFALDRGTSYTLPETGTFIRDDDGKVRFQTDPDWLLEPDQFGLEAMELLELEDEVSGEEPAVEDKATTTASAASAASASAASATPTSATPTSATPASEPASKVTPLAPPEPKKRTRKWRVVWMVAALLVVVLVVLILLPTGENEGGESRLIFWKRKPPVEEVETQGSDTPGGQEISPAQEVEETETPPPTTQETEVTAPPEVADSYFIIAGSFSNLGNASDLQDRLKDRGFEAEVMITENRQYRVSVSSYSSKEEAIKGLAEIKKMPGMESCWLLSN
jgi:cell division protein FtsN/nucleoid DNA-binding protein